MSNRMGIICAVVATPQGFDESALMSMASAEEVNLEMVRPQCLKGRVFQIDPMTGLIASIANRVRQTMLGDCDPARIGIVVASRYGNQMLLKRFAERVRRGGQSPIMFAASGYNVAAGVGAMAGHFNGPSLALAGEAATLSAAVRRAGHLIRREDADVMLACIAESTPDGKKAVAGALVISHPDYTAMNVVKDMPEDIFDLPVEPNRQVLQAVDFAPWIASDVSRLLQLRTHMRANVGAWELQREAAHAHLHE